MRKVFCCLLSAVLLLGLCACAGAADVPHFVETSCDVPATVTPTAAPVVYYEAHPEVPDIGALCGYTLVAHRTVADLDCYYYAPSGAVSPNDGFAQVSRAYTALCEQMGYPPDCDFSSELSLLICFDSDSILISGSTDASDYTLVAIVGTTSTLFDNMDYIA